MRLSRVVLYIATILLDCAFLTAPANAGLPPTIIQGSHFFFENGTQFFIRGVAYQRDASQYAIPSTSTFVDPLADIAGCRRDIPILRELGINTIRVYAINASLDHSECMKMLQDAGIYLIQDLSNPSSSINRDSPEWTTDLLDSYASVVDAMASYSNVMGFFAGNEVTNQANNTMASAFVKAAVRDVKAHIKSRGYRTIGVGYATNDDASIRTALSSYFNCGDQESAVDFWGYNIYSWCGQSSYATSGYDKRTEEFANYPIPVFFSEYGCNTARPRPFTEVQALYGSNMTGVWSGGIVYMYFQEENDYGLVSVRQDIVSKLPDFTSLSKQLALATPSPTFLADYTAVGALPRACPTVGQDWAVATTLPPKASADVCDCMLSSLSCVSAPGLPGDETATLFGIVCGLDSSACVGIAANATSGVYGAYSMCQPTQKLSFAFDQYYKAQGRSRQACSFNGNAHIKPPSVPCGCHQILNEAGSRGTGIITSQITNSTQSSCPPFSFSNPNKKSAASNIIIPRYGKDVLRLVASIPLAVTRVADITFEFF
ncbi:Glucanosyltransferase-domain-containing protein [Xylogone sp. PMI_703]|nr:Glucanosyltransferase-domain-containing protein [Xylogone sp. PMI_703]